MTAREREIQEAASCLGRALALARRGEGHTRPNPPVGAILVRDGVVLGEGWHRRAGHDHAETAALKSAARRGHDVAGATLYVTLEPCSRPGRVGACTDAIVDARIKKVIYAIPDPNGANRDRAKKVLKKAGIACACAKTDFARAMAHPKTAAEKDLAEAVRGAEEIIRPFATHCALGRPFVTVKLAMSLDGRICDESGNARWISSLASRRLAGKMRERVDAIMVGAETVRQDDPTLLSYGRRNDDLVRVVVSRSGNVPKTAKVLTDGRNETLVFRDAREAIENLGKRGFLHVLCEGGLRLARALAEMGLVDAWYLVTAPIVIGSRPIEEATHFTLLRDGPTERASGDRHALYQVCGRENGIMDEP